MRKLRIKKTDCKISGINSALNTESTETIRNPGKFTTFKTAKTERYGE